MNAHKLSMLKGVDQFARTPDVVRSVLLQMFAHKEKVFFDPCPANPTFDGLSIRWKALNFVNPPFDSISAWLEHAVAQQERCDSVFLVPFRAETRYFGDSVVGHASCVIVWINRMVFHPYELPLSTTMATYCIGRRRPKPVTGLRMIKVHARAWDLKTEGILNAEIYDRVLVPSVAEHVGKISAYNKCFVHHGSLKLASSGVTFVGATMNYNQLYNVVITHCEKHPDATVLVLGRTSFNVRYMARVLQKTRLMLLIKPLLALGGFRASYMGSALLMFGKKLKVSVGRPIKNTYFALWHDGEPMKDTE